MIVYAVGFFYRCAVTVKEFPVTAILRIVSAFFKPVKFLLGKSQGITVTGSQEIIGQSVNCKTFSVNSFFGKELRNGIAFPVNRVIKTALLKVPHLVFYKFIAMPGVFKKFRPFGIGACQHGSGP
jgi:hypothetical protein